MSEITTIPSSVVAVIGAGPIGLAAACHLLARGEQPLVLEAGDGPGHAVRQWSHVGMFSPWELNTDKEAVKLLRAHGWRHPQAGKFPTSRDLVVQYLEPLARVPVLEPHIHYRTRVTAVSRKGFDKVRTAGRDDRPFVLRLATEGGAQLVEAKAVIDASGTWCTPNPAGADGLAALGEYDAAHRIAYGIPDVLGTARARYAGKTVMVVGSGHSALNALIELEMLRCDFPSTSLIWIIRKAHVEAAFGGEEADALPARGRLGVKVRGLVESGAVRVYSPFRIARIEQAGGSLEVTGDHDGEDRTLAVDEIIVVTGFRPDLSMLRDLRLTIDPWLESSGTVGPLIDPNLHSCGSVRPHGAHQLAHVENGFFIVGMKSYGRAGTFLLATGYEQARSVAAALTGDIEASRRVELSLPETSIWSKRSIEPHPAAVALAAASAD
jgi:cation diffusion facilitator CzcD-associated flavoprotein CzcO